MATEPVSPADRLPLETFKRPDAVDRWKKGLSLAAATAGGVWLAATLLSPAALPPYAPGPLAHAHAPWEDNCWACHKEFSPVSSDHWAQAGARTPSDQHCQTCHAGPPHHANDNPAAVPGCAACHRDHQGRHASLVRLTEDACIRCHRDLTAHAADRARARTTTEVTRFTDHHPDFKRAAPGADEGKLRFDHKLHMAPGLTLPNTEYQAMNFSLDRIPPKYRDVYRRAGQQDRDLVRLECRSCHRPDGEGDPDARARGATMQPVRYEQHCAACHRLTYDPQAPSDPQTGPPTVPHGLQPGALREYLERLYTTRLVTGPDGKLFDQPRPELPLPGRLPHTEKARTAREEVRRKVEIAERLLYLGKRACGECHVARGREWPLGAVPRVIAGLEFEPPSVPRVWFHSAKFDHAAHRAVDCRECHPDAYARTDKGTWNEKGSRSHTDVLVPDRGTCLQCHSPARTVDGSPRGGARFDCTECHLYHHADRSLRGEDAWRRTGNPAQGIDDLLRWPQRLSE